MKHVCMDCRKHTITSIVLIRNKSVVQVMTAVDSRDSEPQ